MRVKIKHLHRWASLTMAAFWCMQALTGLLLVFHWEIDDATILAAAQAVDIEKIGQRIEALQSEGTGRSVSSIWATAGVPDRFDITVEHDDSGLSEVLRVDGQGDVIRSRTSDELWRNGGFIDTAVRFHQTLLAGDPGDWIIGISGILLLTNMGLGLKLAWPARGQWRRALVPARARTATATLYGWHRALGLWIAPLALMTVSCGTLLVFEDAVGAWLGAGIPEPRPVQGVHTGPEEIRPATAMQIALSRYPGSTIAGVQFPEAESPWYRIRVRQDGEARRVFGTTTLFVDRRSGEVLGDFDAFEAPPARRFMELLFPIHTGEVAGLAGRIAILLIGTWLLSMVALGVSLWWTRRPARRPVADQRT
jgi:uncharacterized iron-regulated membrane protein